MTCYDQPYDLPFHTEMALLQQQPENMEKLPCDVLTNIFIRLPAKLVAQMRSVSKPFNALLSKPSFIKSHLHHSIRNNEEILLVYYNKFSFDSSLYASFKVHPSRSPHLEYTNFIKPPVNTSSDNDVLFEVIGSVNGLICIHRSYPTHVIQIWNPSLSTLLPLPPYTITSSENVLFRFGFDPKNDEYKVVKLTFLLRPLKNQNTARALLFGTLLDVVKEWLQVEVYSMRKGSWKTITQKFLSHGKRIVNEDEVCVDGHDGYIHWLGFIEEDSKLQTIISFDLCMETFGEISLPDSVQDYNLNRWNTLGVLAGKLCLMSCILDSECNSPKLVKEPNL